MFKANEDFFKVPKRHSNSLRSSLVLKFLLFKGADLQAVVYLVFVLKQIVSKSLNEFAMTSKKSSEKTILIP